VTDTLTAYAQGKIDQLSAASLLRTLQPTTRMEGVMVERDGRRLVSFSCNDYLGLSHHPEVKAAAMRAIETYGAGAGASRLVTGDHPLFGELRPGSRR
jgi:8-amino-7-oxononanoate synthase